MTDLSALVVARNEEGQLAACLEALRFADEIVVVLDRSTDGSRAIASRYTQKIIEGAWEVEGARRNTGIDACSGNWILEVDADERVTPELAGAGPIAAGALESLLDQIGALVAGGNLHHRHGAARPLPHSL